MANGVKTITGPEKGDLLKSSSFSAISLYTQPKESSTIYDTVYNLDELGYFTGKKTTSSGITYNEVVPITSLNADGSPNFNGTKLYFDSVLPFKWTANPKYDYGKSGFNLENAVGIGQSILTAIGGIFGIINATKQTTDTEKQEKTSIEPTPPPKEESWLSKNWLYLVGGLLTGAGIGGVVYYSTRNKKKK